MLSFDVELFRLTLESGKLIVLSFRIILWDEIAVFIQFEQVKLGILQQYCPVNGYSVAFNFMLISRSN